MENEENNICIGSAEHCLPRPFDKSPKPFTNVDVNECASKLDKSPERATLDVSLSSEKSSPPTDERSPKPPATPTRRSSVFRMKLKSLFDEAANNDPKRRSCDESGLGLTQPVSEVDTLVPLEEYIERLEAEGTAWSSVRKERKLKYKETLKLTPEVLTRDNMDAILSDADKEFLANAPDYERIAKDLKSLVEESIICARMHEKANILAMKLFKRAEQDLEEITTAVINYS